MADQKKILSIIVGIMGLFGGSLLILSSIMAIGMFNYERGLASGFGSSLEALGVNPMIAYFSFVFTFITGALAIIGTYLLAKSGVSPSRKLGALLILAMGVLSLAGSYIYLINTPTFYFPGYGITIQIALVGKINFLGPPIIGEPSGILLIAGVLGFLAISKEKEPNPKK